MSKYNDIIDKLFPITFEVRDKHLDNLKAFTSELTEKTLAKLEEENVPKEYYRIIMRYVYGSTADLSLSCMMNFNMTFYDGLGETKNE